MVNNHSRYILRIQYLLAMKWLNGDVFDTVIVGSGPCGASTAKRLVDGGANVLIIERDTLPRFKMCGGMLDPD